MSVSQKSVMSCSWGVKAGMVRVWVAGKLCDPTVTHRPYLSALEIDRNTDSTQINITHETRQCQMFNTVDLDLHSRDL